jgi:FkbM family methyltransferase
MRNINLNNNVRYDKYIFNEVCERKVYTKSVPINYGDLVVDLGCSKGYLYYTYQDKKIKYIGVDGRVDCLNDFRIALEDHDNVDLINMLIMNETKVVPFASMFHDDRVSNVQTITIESLFKSIPGKINFLKFDIEGWEYCLLQNPTLFKSKVERFSSEIHFSGQFVKAKTVLDSLRNFVLDPNIFVKFFSVDGTDITTYFWTNPEFYQEFLMQGFVVN